MQWYLFGTERFTHKMLSDENHMQLPFRAEGYTFNQKSEPILYHCNASSQYNNYLKVSVLIQNSKHIATSEWDPIFSITLASCWNINDHHIAPTQKLVQNQTSPILTSSTVAWTYNCMPTLSATHAQDNGCHHLLSHPTGQQLQAGQRCSAWRLTQQQQTILQTPQLHPWQSQQWHNPPSIQAWME